MRTDNRFSPPELGDSGGAVLDLLDRFEDHRRRTLDRPAHQMPKTVAFMYLGKPLFDWHEFAVRALVVMSQHVSTLDSAYGAGSNSRLRTSASPRSPASMMAQEWRATSRHSMASACCVSRRYRAPSSACKPVTTRAGA
jgi:hypothetical protein